MFLNYIRFFITFININNFCFNYWCRSNSFNLSYWFNHFNRFNTWDNIINYFYRFDIFINTFKNRCSWFYWLIKFLIIFRYLIIYLSFCINI